MGNHNEHGHGGAGHGSHKEYITGLILSIILTVIPFATVMMKLTTPVMAIAIILVCAVAQLLVQAIFFLHMNSSSEQSWNVMTGIYSVIIFVVLIIGSMWIFAHLNHNILMGH